MTTPSIPRCRLPKRLVTGSCCLLLCRRVLAPSQTPTPGSSSRHLQHLVWKELDYGQMCEREKQMLVSEVNILREFRHPNIVRYYDRIIDRDR